MGKLLHSFMVELVTPEGVSESIEALSVVLPASDGQVGILGGRAPLVAHLGAGRMTVTGRDGARGDYYVAGGFARMQDDVLTVLAEECTPVDRIDPDAAWDDIERALAMPSDTAADLERRDGALHAARTRFRLVQERRARRRAQRGR